MLAWVWIDGDSSGTLLITKVCEFKKNTDWKVV